MSSYSIWTQDDLNIEQDFLPNDICIYTKDRISSHPLRKCNSRSQHRRHRHRVDDICKNVYVVMIGGELKLTRYPSPHPARTSDCKSNPKVFTGSPVFYANPKTHRCCRSEYLWQSFISFVGLSWLTSTSTTILGHGAPFPMNFNQSGGGWGMLFRWRWNEASGRLTERLFRVQSMTIRTITKEHTIV